MGAALGMVISMAAAAAYGFWLMGRGGLVIHWHRDMDKSWDWPVVKQLFRFGLPAGVQGVVMNIGGVLMLRFMGALPQSGHVQAVYAVGYSELFAFITWTSVGLMGAAATVAGQSLGAKKPDRVVEAVHTANKLGLGIAAFVGSLFLLIPAQLFGLFGMRDAASVEIGVTMLRWLAVSGFFIATALTYTGGLTGTGDTKGPLYISIVSQVIFPLGLLFLLQRTTTLVPAYIWAAIVLGHFTRAVLSIWRFRSGKWREIRIEPARAR
jgi:Na+-driven multidrug efflux pump